jgi:hypothetical protein
MNSTQREKIARLQNELRTRRGVTTALPIVAEKDDYVFTEVEGVTVLVGASGGRGPRGGYKLPSVRTYRQKGLDAAVNARDLWERQKERDDADPAIAASWITGHLSPIVNTEWRCTSNSCPCQGEDIGQREGRSLG